MSEWAKKCWPATKLVLGGLLLAAVSRQFLHDLAACPDLARRPLSHGWLALAGLLYLAGLGFSALYWHRLLVALDQTPSPWNSARAYFVGHLGKYVPGKAWALFLRASLARGPGVHVGVAVYTALYEVLATMAGGMILATILFACLAPDRYVEIEWNQLARLSTLRDADETAIDRKVLVVASLLVLGVVGWPIVPTVFDVLVGRMTLPFRTDEHVRPKLETRTLIEGLLLSACGWSLLGASLGCVIRATGYHVDWNLAAWGRETAYLTLAYVVGFVILVAPSGLGVREYFLKLFLVPELLVLGASSESEARASAVLVVIVTRLVWTGAELAACAAVWPRWSAFRQTESRFRP